MLAAGSLEPDGELVDTLGVVDAVRPVRPADEAETGTPGAPRLDVAPQVVAQLVGFDPDEGSELPLDRRARSALITDKVEQTRRTGISLDRRAGPGSATGCKAVGASRAWPRG